MAESNNPNGVFQKFNGREQSDQGERAAGLHEENRRLQTKLRYQNFYGGKPIANFTAEYSG
jgi:hypothetical protein